MGSNWMKWRYFIKFLNIDRASSYGVIVDVGCGPGNWTMRIANHFPSAKIIGVDKSSDSIIEANRKIKDQNIKNVHFLKGSAAAIPLQSGSVDRVITTQVYEHLAFPDNRGFLYEVNRILKVNGYLVLNTTGDLLSNYSFPIFKFLSLFPYFVKRHPLLRFFKANKRYPYEWHGHIVPDLSPSDITSHLAEVNGLSFCQYGYTFKKFDAIHFQVRSLSRQYGSLLAPFSFLFSLLDLLHNSKGLDLTCQIKKVDVAP